VALAKQVEVWLVYEEELYENRKALGWYVPEFNGVRLVSIEHAENMLPAFLQNLDHDYHLFSGINAYPKISNYFRIFYKRDPSRVLCLLEKPGGVPTGLKSHMRRLMYRYFAYRYKRLKFLLTPGGEKYLVKAGFAREKIIPFGYFGPLKAADVADITETGRAVKKLVYVGNLSKLKNTTLLIRTLKMFETDKWQLSVIGDGEERDALMRLVNDLALAERTFFLGSKSNDEVQTFLAESDCLFLPSLYDGWGYVVNEALSAGCSVICSDACGVSTVLDGCKTCCVFHSDSIDSLYQAIESLFGKKINATERKKSVAFFNSHLSGESGANMLVKLLDIGGKKL
jgi:glycosyltransferase involved in cell wall biosynthesis